MNIVFLQDDFPPESSGGAGMVAGALARALAARGHRVSVIAATQKKDRAGKEEWEGLPVYRIYSAYPERWRAWKSLYNPSTVGEIQKLLHELRPDIVHAHNVHYHLSYASLAAAKKIGAKVFLTAHDAMLVSYGKLPIGGRTTAWREFARSRLRFNPLRAFYIRHYLKNVHTLFVVSEALRRALEAGGIHGAKVMHNGIDTSLWGVAPGSLQNFSALHHLENKKMILFGGRISAQKGGEVILASMPYIIHAAPNAILAIAGRESAYVQKLLQEAEKLGIASHIILLGWLSGAELREAYTAAEILVVPSIYLDPLPTVALEAMASHKPVVASPFGGLPELVMDGKTGYIVDPRDTASFAAKIVVLLEDAALARQMGKAGYDRALKHFSMEDQITKLISLYEA